MVKKVISKKRRSTKTVRRRKLQTKKNDLANAAMALGAAATYGAAKRYFGNQYSVFDKPYGNMTNPTQLFNRRQPRIKGPREKNQDPGTGGYSQWTQRYATGKFGKLTPKKIDKLSNDTIILRHQLIGPFNDYGQRFMYNALDATTNGNLWYPLILFELNSANNYINGTQNFINPVHQMYQPAGTTNIAWNSLTTQSQNGAAVVQNWLFEKSGHTNTAVPSHPMEQSIHKWTSLDLELWGQTSKPTMYTIYLCQFNEDVLPGTTYTSSVGSYSTITDQNAVEFWQSMVKRYTYSPLLKIDDGYSNKKIKILKQYKVNIDPTATYENDPDPHVKTLKLFYRFNRRCNFQWKYSNAAGQTIADMDDKDWQQEDGENQCQVHPNARLFVMIRASNFQRQTLLSSATNANTPSISWVMRSCHLINQ